MLSQVLAMEPHRRLLEPVPAINMQAVFTTCCYFAISESPGVQAGLSNILLANSGPSASLQPTLLILVTKVEGEVRAGRGKGFFAQKRAAWRSPTVTLAVFDVGAILPSERGFN